MHLNSLRTPFIYVDAARLRANIRAMAERAAAAGVRLRPHAKTHKSVEIAKWQVEAGAVGVCCAKLGEAEVLAAGGIGDIRLPYPVNPVNADRVIALLDKTRLSIIVDDMDVARGWSDAMTAAGKTLVPERPLWLILLAGWAVPFAVWNYLMAFTTYLNHTHPAIAWFDDEKTWARFRGNLMDTANVLMPVDIAPLYTKVMAHPAQIGRAHV